MLSIGWPEMMVVAAAALIIIGPRDLPALLRRLGQAAGSVRRMSNEFRAEINKVAALDDIKEIKDSVSLPFTKAKAGLNKATADLNKEFNKITPTGVEPTGAIAPKDAKAESVYDEIKAVAGKPATKAKTTKSKTTKSAKPKTAKAKSAATKSAATKTGTAKTTATKTATDKKPAVRKAPVKAKAAASKAPATKTTAKKATSKAAPAKAATVRKKPATVKASTKPRTTKPRTTKAKVS